MTAREVAARGWDAVDVVFVTGDAYVDHPSFAMALLGRLLEAEGYRVAILAQPDWHSCEPWRTFGRPRLCFAISAGNMDSMLNHYTANRKVRNDDAYSPDGRPRQRPDRATLAYCQRAREAYRGVPVVTGGVEASLRRIAHYDYWSDKVRRSIILDSKADLLVYGMGERPLVEIVRRLAEGQTVEQLRDIRGVAYRLGASEAAGLGASGEGRGTDEGRGTRDEGREKEATVVSGCHAHARVGMPKHRQTWPRKRGHGTPVPETDKTPGTWGEGREKEDEATVVLPSYEDVATDPLAFARMTRTAYRETNPFNARRLVQFHGREAVVVNPPAFPLAEADMDRVYGLPFARRPHPSYGQSKIPAFEVVKTSVQIVRGCFGGCAFCSITSHEGRVIQSRSQASVLTELRHMVDDPEFKGVVSDIGGPTANMYRMNCSRPEVRAQCRRLSCIHPQICALLNTDHGPIIELMKAAREEPGVKKVLVASGVRMDLARHSRKYVDELTTHHTGGLLKVAPEHSDPEVLRLMKKPPIEEFEAFDRAFHRACDKAGKQQYLVPYFIAGHPGSDLRAMIHLAQFLKKSGYRPDKVQDFIPAPMDLATCMYHTGIDPISEQPVYVAKGARERRLQRALLQYWKPENYDDVCRALEQAGRMDLIGSGPDCLVPSRPPRELRRRKQGRRPTGGEKPSATQATDKKKTAAGYRPHRKTGRRRH